MFSSFRQRIVMWSRAPSEKAAAWIKAWRVWLGVVLALIGAVLTALRVGGGWQRFAVIIAVRMLLLTAAGLLEVRFHERHVDWLIRRSERHLATASGDDQLRLEHRIEVLRGDKRGCEYVAHERDGRARWRACRKALHADDGYAPPPASLVRALVVMAETPPQNILMLPELIVVVLMGAGATIGLPVLVAEIHKAAHVGLSALGALAWAVVLSIPGEFLGTARHWSRRLLWGLGAAILICAYATSKRSYPHAFARGASLTILSDYIGVATIMFMVYAREFPDTGAWQEGMSSWPWKQQRPK